jgi:hypothetical protein
VGGVGGDGLLTVPLYRGMLLATVAIFKWV